MPIKGLTDRGLAFPEIGQIRKGAKKGDNRPGADLTYFRVEFDEQEKDTAAAFLKVYGPKPAYIRIILPFNEIERMWDAWLEAYTAGRLVARSDGEFIAYQLDNHGDVIVHNWMDDSGNKVPHPANGVAGQDYKGNAVMFKPTGRLKVIVPELSRAAYLTVMTTSTHDIANISAQLAAFKELNGGQLAGIPFILRRRPKQISTPSGDNGQRARRVKWLISIEADPEWVKAKIGQIKTLALPASVDESAVLPAEVEQVDDAVIDFDDGEVENQDMHEMTYEEAAETIILTKNGAERVMGMLGVEQLNRVILNSGDLKLTEAAKIVLKHDHDMEPPEA
jgi:hypothetical protein